MPPISTHTTSRVLGRAFSSWLAVFFLLWSPWVHAQGDFHVVQAGETLAGIAERHGVSEEVLRAVNAQLFEGGAAPGEALRIPPPGGQLVRLGEGESVLELALLHGVPIAEVARVNGLTSLADAQAGQLLYLPPAADAPLMAAALDGRAQLASQQGQLLARAAALLKRYEPRPVGYRWPLEVPGRISSRFGVRTISVGGNTFHGGVDIAVPMGTPVVAAQDGVVARAGWIGAYGLAVFVDHEGGAQTRYAHLSAMAVTPGARIAQGELLGWVGSTGASTGPHLHFELRFAGHAVDPLGYLTPLEYQD